MNPKDYGWRSGGVDRPSIRDSQSLDSGPNPDRSIYKNLGNLKQIQKDPSDSKTLLQKVKTGGRNIVSNFLNSSSIEEILFKVSYQVTEIYH